jgi:glycosyltransferase involved in cell wall biosynthesis
LGQIEHLRELGWDIQVVMPNYNDPNLLISDKLLQIPFGNLFFQKINFSLERLGLLEDYFDGWVKKAYRFLTNKVSGNDIIFATSGGELGMIKLGALIKKQTGCKFLINFHDPLDYSLVHGLKIDNKLHISRETVEKKYLHEADLIITSSESYRISLCAKYPEICNRIINNYFGYISNHKPNDIAKEKSKSLRIACVGNFGKLQKPEILYEAFRYIQHKEKIKIYFIGKNDTYKPLKRIKDSRVKFIDYLPHTEFLQFMSQNIDVGFVSLANDYLGACFPSKIYEYINLGLPILGALPNGDGRDIINQNGYGLAPPYSDISEIAEAMVKMHAPGFLKLTRENLLRDTNKWAMASRIQEVNTLLGSFR